MVSSTIPELLAIAKPLLIARDVAPQPLVILTDTCCVLQALVHSREDIVARGSSKVFSILQGRRFQLVLQWIPSHLGVTSNGAADHLASQYHISLTSVAATGDPRRGLWSV